MQRLLFLLLLISGLFSSTSAQRDNNWVLANSGIKINWSINGISIDSVFQPSFMMDYYPGNNSAISNSNGQLLFYQGANTIWNKDFAITEDAPDTNWLTSSYMFSLQNDNFILPVANDTSLYIAYLAQVCANSFNPPYQSLIKYKVSPWYNNLWQPYDGKVLSSDTLFNGGGFLTSDAITAVKHGNGRDWWILYHANFTDSFMVWRQEMDGSLSGPFYQEIGPYQPQQGYDWMRLAFTPDGNRMALMMMYDIYIFDFDRCSGQLSNPIEIDTCPTCPSQAYWNPNFKCSFSPDGSKLYVTRNDSLLQFDLSGFPTTVQKEVVWYWPNGYEIQGADLIGNLKLAPDGKIIVGTVVFQDTTSNDSGSHFLGVIRSPNSVGMACNFDRYGLYLNGFKSNAVLSSYINYDLGPLLNSPCDTLTTTSISEQSTKPKISLAPNPAQTQATLTWSGVAEGTFILRDMLGRAVLREVLNAPNGTTRLDLSTLPKGIYVWQVQSAAITKNGKLVVE
jgi:hypothetical protein